MKLVLLTFLSTMTILTPVTAHSDPCPIYDGAPGLTGYDPHPKTDWSKNWDVPSHVAGSGTPGHRAEAPYDGGTGGNGGTGYHTYSGNGGDGGSYRWDSGLLPGKGGEGGIRHWDIKKTQSSGK